MLNRLSKTLLTDVRKKTMKGFENNKKRQKSSKKKKWLESGRSRIQGDRYKKSKIRSLCKLKSK